MLNPTLPNPPRPTHLASLGAALQSGDREALARTCDEMATELMELADKAPTMELWMFLGGLHESFYGTASALREPAKPSRASALRRWLRDRRHGTS
ncbi:hypothetical protein ACFVAF_04115 [Streptomyces sp. NPDC057596]|uniref:hypothetical protein n=1 Tax=Streptomyces sp. NPDC057596 TaxID=3346178 RepID=UPI0036C346D8